MTTPIKRDDQASSTTDATMTPQQGDGFNTAALKNGEASRNSSDEVPDKAKLNVRTCVEEFCEDENGMGRVLVTIQQSGRVEFGFENRGVVIEGNGHKLYSLRLSVARELPMLMNGEFVDKVEFAMAYGLQMVELVEAMRAFVAWADRNPELVEY